MRRLALVLGIAATGCLDAPAFHCADDAQCTLGGTPGRCEAGGFCSLADPTCDTGYRFADGTPQAGECAGLVPNLRTGCLVRAHYAPAAGSCERRICDEIDATCCTRMWGETCVHAAETLCQETCSGVLATASPTEVAVARWAGGAYVPVWSEPLSDEPAGDAVAWADFDGDGDADLALCEGHVKVQIWRNGGTCDEPFCKVAEVASPPDCLTLHWVDLDGDGDLDVVGAGSYQGFGWLVDDGLWPTTLATMFPDVPGDPTAPSAFVSRLAWTDVDGDGVLDAAVARYEHPLTVGRTATRGAQQAPDLPVDWSDDEAVRHRGACWGDVDRDGVVDLVTVGEALVKVRRGTSAAGFVPAATPYFDGGTSVATLDVTDCRLVDADRDGDLDLLVPIAGGPPTILRNTLIGGSAPTFGALNVPLWQGGAALSSTRAAVGDVDGDHVEDLVIATEPKTGLTAGLSVYLAGERDGKPAWGAADDTASWTDPAPHFISDLALAPDWQ